MRRSFIYLLIAFTLLITLFAPAETGNNIFLSQPETAHAQTLSWSGVFYTDTALLTTSGYTSNATSTGTTFTYSSVTNPPSALVNSNNFSVRWTASSTLTPGTYTFTLRAVDGARFKVQRGGIASTVISDPNWSEGTAGTVIRDTPYQASQTYEILSGDVLIVEAYNVTDAFDTDGSPLVVELSWGGGASYNTGGPWTTQFYNCSTTLGTPPDYLTGCAAVGSPVQIQAGSTAPIAQTWSTNSPYSGVNADHWRADFSRQVTLQPGTLIIQSKVDDVMRIAVEDSANPGAFSQANQTGPFFLEGELYEWSYTIPTATTYTIRVNYFDYVDKAYLYLTYSGAGSTDGGGVIPADPNNPSGGGGSGDGSGDGSGGGGGGTPVATGVTATGNANVGVNVRQLPNTSATKIGLLAKGQVVAITGRLADNSWLRIDYGGQIGWVTSAWVVITGDLNTVPVVDPNTGTDTDGDGVPDDGGTITDPGSAVTTARAVGNVRIRTGPGLSYDRVTFVPWGTEVLVYGQSGDFYWIKIQYNDPDLGSVVGWSYKYWYRESNNLFALLPLDLPVVDGSGVTPPSSTSFSSTSSTITTNSAPATTSVDVAATTDVTAPVDTTAPAASAPAETGTTGITATSPNATAACECTADTLSCSDFSSQAASQACFNACRSEGAGDIHNLDPNADLIACEDFNYNQ